MHKKYDFSLFCIETREFDAMTTLLTDQSVFLSQVCHLKNSFLCDHPCDKILILFANYLAYSYLCTNKSLNVQIFKSLNTL